MIIAAILAAGTSSRLGQPKQLLRLNGETLVHRVARVALDADVAHVFVVVADDENAALIADELRDLPVEIVVNSQWREGMASSVRRATRAALDAREVSNDATDASIEGDALLLMPCDLPRLNGAHLRDLIEKFERENAPVVASRYRETLGAPLIIARELWPELMQLRGDVGARRVIMRHDANWIEWPDGALDVDTRQDWANLGYEF